MVVGFELVENKRKKCAFSYQSDAVQVSKWWQVKQNKKQQQRKRINAGWNKAIEIRCAQQSVLK